MTKASIISILGSPWRAIDQGWVSLYVEFLTELGTLVGSAVDAANMHVLFLGLVKLGPGGSHCITVWTVWREKLKEDTFRSDRRQHRVFVDEECEDVVIFYLNWLIAVC
jgi:hypothetical protein